MNTKQDLLNLIQGIINHLKERVESKRIESSELEGFCNSLEKLSNLYYNYPAVLYNDGAK